MLNSPSVSCECNLEPFRYLGVRIRVGLVVLPFADVLNTGMLMQNVIFLSADFVLTPPAFQASLICPHGSLRLRRAALFNASSAFGKGINFSFHSSWASKGDVTKITCRF